MWSLAGTNRDPGRPRGMPYRGRSAPEPDLHERRELAALAHGRTMRLLRTALTLGTLGVGLGLFASMMGSRRGREAPLCHHVKIVLEQAEGAPPPPMEWTTCEKAHDLTGRIERSYNDLPQL